MRCLRACIINAIHAQPGIAINFTVPYDKDDKNSKEVEKEIQRIKTDVQHKFDNIKRDINDRLLESDISVTITLAMLTGDAGWVVFRNMAYLLLSVYNSISDECDISYITFQDIRHNVFLFLLPDDASSGVRLNQFYDGSIMKNYILKHSNIVDDKIKCDIVL